jgi:hypothetical protein
MRGSETDLVIDDLLERTTLVQQSVKLDDVRVLVGLRVSQGAPGEERPGRLTVASYWLEVPSKQRTITLGWGTVESVDIVEGRRSENLGIAATTPKGFKKHRHLGGSAAPVAHRPRTTTASPKPGPR